MFFINPHINQIEGIKEWYFKASISGSLNLKINVHRILKRSHAQVFHNNIEPAEHWLIQVTVAIPFCVTTDVYVNVIFQWNVFWLKHIWIIGHFLHWWGKYIYSCYIPLGQRNDAEWKRNQAVQRSLQLEVVRKGK